MKDSIFSNEMPFIFENLFLLIPFLEIVLQAGFQSNKCTFVPVSGLDGDNLTAKVGPDHQLNQWYKGPTLLEAIGRSFEKCYLNIF